jgi:hypothetical protein
MMALSASALVMLGLTWYALRPCTMHTPGILPPSKPSPLRPLICQCACPWYLTGVRKVCQCLIAAVTRDAS